ncbi:MAG: efflux RND transporter periplasmic adaptor subunit [Pseudomonadota bacterium]
MSPQIKPVADAPAEPARAPLWHRTIGLVLQIALPVLLAYGAYKAQDYILASAPVAERGARDRVARLVEVLPAAPAPISPRIEAWGEVTAAETLIVRPEIAGTIVWTHPDLGKGGYLPEGEVVARLDDTDLKLAVQQAEAEVAEIDARILIEQGQGEIGKRELTRLSRNLTDTQRALVLREPQMAQLSAERIAAEAALEQARNAIEKTSVKVPFNALVVTEQVAPGTMLTQGAEAAELVSADRFNVTVAVPAQQLSHIEISPETRVEILVDGGGTRAGEILRVGSGLTEVGRMAELIVAVPDPMARLPENAGNPPLLLGSFVTVKIDGRTVDDAVELDRRFLRDGGTVWVMNAEDTLEIRTVSIAWRGPDSVVIDGGLNAGDRIVTSRLSSFTEGMALRVREDSGA